MGLFSKAVKHDAKLRLAISGPSGSGKTFTALTIAATMNTGKRIALVDTEHGSASKYADLFDFDVAEMHPPFHPEKFVSAIKDAAQAGYGVIILDSLTHAWNGEGGMLELVTEIAKRKYQGNSYAAWNDATPIQKNLIEAIIGTQIHVIATMRAKMDYVLEKDEKTGKSSPKKVGMAPEQRADMPYEFDVMLDMNIDNEAIVSKTRCPALAGRVITKPGKNIADVLVKWLQAEPQAQTVSQPTAQPQHRQPPTSAAPATNGNGHKPAPQPPATHSVESLDDVQESPVGADVVPSELERQAAAIIADNKLQAPPKAQAWAVTAGYCANEHEARNSWKKIVDQSFGGKMDMVTMPKVVQAYVVHQLEKQPVVAN